jgi:hypothetical protein
VLQVAQLLKSELELEFCALAMKMKAKANQIIFFNKNAVVVIDDFVPTQHRRTDVVVAHGCSESERDRSGSVF